MKMEAINMFSKRILFLFALSLFTLEIINLFAQKPQSKRSIVFFSSRGGGGHESVRKAFQAEFDDIYDIEPAYIFGDTLRKIDHIQTLTFGKIKGEDVYNFCLRHKMNRTINLFYSFGRFNYSFNRGKAGRLIRRYLQEKKPDLVISAIPIVNDIILKVTKELDIPFLLIPTDLDVSIFMKGIDNPDYKKFHVALPFNEPEALKTIQPAHIPKEQISIIGFPIRPDFFEKKDIQKIKKDFDIPTNKPSVLILMGAAGSSASYNYAKELAKVRLPVHYIFVLGRNTKLRPKIENINWPSNISTSVLGFTSRMSDLMAIADMGIIKSGTLSTVESIYSNLVLLLDANDQILKWEQLNHALTQKHGFGCQITYNNAQWLITGLLSHPEVVQEFKQNIRRFEKKRFSKEIRSIIDNLINQPKSTIVA